MQLIDRTIQKEILKRLTTLEARKKTFVCYSSVLLLADYILWNRISSRNKHLPCVRKQILPNVSTERYCFDRINAE